MDINVRSCEQDGEHELYFSPVLYVTVKNYHGYYYLTMQFWLTYMLASSIDRLCQERLHTEIIPPNSPTTEPVYLMMNFRLVDFLLVVRTFFLRRR